MITREIKKYQILDDIIIYLYSNLHIGITYSAKICTSTEIRSKRGFRSLKGARIWAEKEAKNIYIRSLDAH